MFFGSRSRITELEKQLVPYKLGTEVSAKLIVSLIDTPCNHLNDLR